MENLYLKMDNVSKSINKNIILENINLNFERGKIYGIRGRNGSGKTMLFRAICGLITIDEGKITINNKILGKEISLPESVGVLIEYPGFLDNFDGYNNLKYLADIKGIVGENEIKLTMKKVGLDPEDKRKFKKYSLGMKQRLGIAQAIMENPDLLLLDEPTNALDVEGVKLINEIILDLKQQQKTIIITNHKLDELEGLVDELITIDAGKIINIEKLESRQR